MHRFLTAAWEELGLDVSLTVSNALKHPMWEFYDRLAGSRHLAPARRRRPMEQSRRRGGRKSLPPINRSPVSARGAHGTELCWSGLCGRPRNEAREVGLCPAVSSACKTWSEVRCREDQMSFSEAADWPQDPGPDGPNTLCNGGLRLSPTTELLLFLASASLWSTPSSLLSLIDHRGRRMLSQAQRRWPP